MYCAGTCTAPTRCGSSSSNIEASTVKGYIWYRKQSKYDVTNKRYIYVEAGSVYHEACLFETRIIDIDILVLSFVCYLARIIENLIIGCGA